MDELVPARSAFSSWASAFSSAPAFTGAQGPGSTGGCRDPHGGVDPALEALAIISAPRRWPRSPGACLGTAICCGDRCRRHGPWDMMSQ